VIFCDALLVMVESSVVVIWQMGVPFGAFGGDGCWF
jgi:hypothetical protein